MMLNDGTGIVRRTTVERAGIVGTNTNSAGATVSYVCGLPILSNAHPTWFSCLCMFHVVSYCSVFVVLDVES
jgi:hypothetical protein